MQRSICEMVQGKRKMVREDTTMAWETLPWIH